MVLKVISPYVSFGYFELFHPKLFSVDPNHLKLLYVG